MEETIILSTTTGNYDYLVQDVNGLISGFRGFTRCLYPEDYHYYFGVVLYHLRNIIRVFGWIKKGWFTEVLY